MIQEVNEKYRVFLNMDILLANIESLKILEQSKEILKETMIFGNWELIERIQCDKRNGICEFCGKRNLKWTFHIKNIQDNISYMIGGSCLEKKTRILTHKTAINKLESWESIKERIEKSKTNFDNDIEEFIEWGLPKINAKTDLFGIELEIVDIIESLLDENYRKIALGRLKTIAHNMGVKD